MAPRTLTRKHYQMVATILADFRSVLRTGEWESMVNRFCDEFEKDSPYFDRTRFKLACTIGDDPGPRYRKKMKSEFEERLKAMKEIKLKGTIIEMDEVKLTGKIGEPVPAGSVVRLPKESWTSWKRTPSPYRTLADAFVRLEKDAELDDELTMLANEILTVIDFPLEDTEMGLSPDAWEAVYSWVEEHRTPDAPMRKTEIVADAVLDELNKLTPGDRIELIEMPFDPDPIPRGEQGTVTSVNEMQIGVKWDCGRTLSLVPGVDTYERKEVE